MKLHANAALSLRQRERMARRVVELGWSLTKAAAAAEVSERTCSKWVRRYRGEGLAGLADRSSAPGVVANRTEERTVQAIAALRRLRFTGPDIAELLDRPVSTISGILTRIGMGKLGRLGMEPANRYERQKPGELIHVDVKKLGRVPDGGGHRMLGPSARHDRGLGYDYLHVAVDDATRLAFVGVHPDERAATTVRFMRDAAAFFADHGVRVERVMTDNAMTYIRSRELAWLFAELGIRHLRTRPRRPQTNGKAERFIGTLQREWAYARLFRSNADRLASLPRWLDTYNRRRPHAGLDGLTPLTVLVNKVGGNDS